MTEQMPKDMVVALRQILKAFSAVAPGTLMTWPEWFKELEQDGPWKGWTTLMSTAADDLETMQKLNGKLYKTLYPD